MPQVTRVFTEECQDDREVQDDKLFILFDRQPRGELEGLHQAEEAGEGLQREIEKKARVPSFDSVRPSRNHLERGTFRAQSRRGWPVDRGRGGVTESSVLASVDGMVNSYVFGQTMTFGVPGLAGGLLRQTLKLVFCGPVSFSVHRRESEIH
jgi:hypothetical protein